MEDKKQMVAVLTGGGGRIAHESFLVTRLAAEMQCGVSVLTSVAIDASTITLHCKQPGCASDVLEGMLQKLGGRCWRPRGDLVK